MMDTKTVRRPARAFIVPAGITSSDATVQLPLEIHHVQDGLWYAAYDGAPDVGYQSLEELLEAHALGHVSYDDVVAWNAYSYQRDVELAA